MGRVVIPHYFAGSKMMIITGAPESMSDEHIFVDVLNPNACFKRIPNFPLNLRYAVGGVIKNRPIICGGHNVDYSGDNWNGKLTNRSS